MEVDCMPTRQRSAWHRRWPISRRLRVAVPIAIPVALAVTLGVFIVVSGGGHVSQVNQSALANCASPAADASTSAPDTGTSTSAPDPAGSASAPAPAGSASAPDPAGSASAPAPAGSASAPDPAASAGSSASAAPCPSATASVNAVAAASPSASAPPVNPEAGRPDLAEANPVDPTGAAISLNQTPDQAANSLNCTLIVPNQPLSARGLATPWQLSDGCSEANPNEEAFVESTILAPTGKLKIYDPLVITQGTTPAATPTVPVIPRGAQVIINVGFNGNNLVLEGGGAFQGRCIDAFGNSIIAQTSACNAAAFYADANFQIATGRLRVPRLGTGTDGQACESTESFSLIDQDQSDNVVSEYLMDGNGQTAQDTVANKNAMGGAAVLANGSDDGLLAHFVDPALGCTPFEAPDSTSPNGMDSSQATNALSALVNQRGPRALLPVNDPQLLVAGQFSIGKTNTYRTLTDEPLLSSFTNKTQNAATYCQEMTNIQPGKLQLDVAKETNFTTPVPAVGNNLATFMGGRLAASFTNLNCQNFGLTNPVTVTMDGNGVATAVTFNTSQQQMKLPAGTGKGRRGGYNRRVAQGRKGHKENGSGM
jgi:hypothetical protein